MSSHNSRGEESGVQTINEPQNCTGWRDISSAPRDNSQIVVAQPLDHPGRWTASSMRLVPGDYDFRPGSVWTKLPDLSSSGERSIGSSERQRAEGNPATDELETLRSTVERLTGAWSEVDRLSSANQAMFERLTQAIAERDEARRERAHYSEAYREARDDAIARERRAKSAEKQLAEAVGIVRSLRFVLRMAAFKFDFDLTGSAAMDEAEAFLAQHNPERGTNVSELIERLKRYGRSGLAMGEGATLCAEVAASLERVEYRLSVESAALRECNDERKEALARVEAMRKALEAVSEAINDSDDPEAFAIIRHALSAQHQSPQSSDPDLGRIGPGHVCKHGVRWPHACNECDVAAFALTAEKEGEGDE